VALVSCSGVQVAAWVRPPPRRPRRFGRVETRVQAAASNVPGRDSPPLPSGEAGGEGSSCDASAARYEQARKAVVGRFFGVADWRHPPWLEPPLVPALLAERAPRRRGILSRWVRRGRGRQHQRSLSHAGSGELHRVGIFGLGHPPLGERGSVRCAALYGWRVHGSVSEALAGSKRTAWRPSHGRRLLGRTSHRGPGSQKEGSRASPAALRRSPLLGCSGPGKRLRGGERLTPRQRGREWRSVPSKRGPGELSCVREAPVGVGPVPSAPSAPRETAELQVDVGREPCFGSPSR
jgi:hypothetical protein